MKRVDFHPSARAEVREALRYVDEQRAGLARELRRELATATERIRRRPRSFPTHEARGRAVRNCLLQRFSYTIVFVELADVVWVAAVAHQLRRPVYWADREP